MLINPAIAGLTWRQSLANRRWIIVAVVATLPVIMALVSRIYSSNDEPIAMVSDILTTLGLVVVVPVIALTLASSGFGAEIDDGTVVYLVTKPISRVAIVATKLLVTASVCVAATVLSVLATGLVGLHHLDATRLVLGFAVAAALGSVLYTSIFLAMGLITRRGMLVGLIYMVVWEGTISQLFPGMRSLSVRQYMLVVVDAVSTVDPASHIGNIPSATAWQMSIILAVATVALCIYRLRNFEVGQSG